MGNNGLQPVDIFAYAGSNPHGMLQKFLSFLLLADSKSSKVNYTIEFQSVIVYFRYLWSPAWPVDMFVNSSSNPHGM